MKLAIVSKNSKDKANVAKEFRKFDCSVVQKNPDIVLSIGGDGTFLFAERKYPSVPKLLIRDNSICKKCNVDRLHNIAHKILHKHFSIKSYKKIEGIVHVKKKKHKIIAANDIVVRNKEQIYALRFEIKIDGKKEELIGDGVVCSTAFGAEGYFYSITKHTFTSGVGIAFNNLTRNIRSTVRHTPEIKITIQRNHAYVSHDNVEKLIVIGPGDSVEVTQSKQKFHLIHLKR